jgi:hypothetical protein
MEKKEQARETVIGIMPYDREKVLSKLKQKKYDDIFIRDRGRLDDFVGFLYQTGVLGLFDGIDSRMERKPEIPRQFLHYCISLKPVVDSASINQLPGRLLEDTDSLRTLGFTMVAMEKGFSVKNKNGNNVPVNINAFYDELARLPETESKKFFTSGVELLDKKRFLSKKSGVYALDGVKLLITGDKKYENYGKITIEDKNGKRVKEKGYKLVFLQRVDGDDHYIVAAKLIPLNQQEITVAEELVEEALCVLGENSIKTLLIDRGFLSGSFFDYLGGKGIDFICPTKDTLHLTRHMQGLHRAGEGVKTTLADGTVLAGYNCLIPMDGCKRKINGVLIIKQGNKARKKVIEGNEFGFLTSLPTGQNQQIEKVYNLYSRRWKIEVNGNRELKSQWYINKFPSQKWNGLCTHIYFTLFMFNVVAAFKSKKGRALTEKGMLSIRNKYFTSWSKTHTVNVIAGGYCATFPFKDFVQIFGLPPPSGKYENSFWVTKPDGRKELWYVENSKL